MIGHQRLESGSVNVYASVDCDNCHLHGGVWDA